MNELDKALAEAKEGLAKREGVEVVTGVTSTKEKKPVKDYSKLYSKEEDRKERSVLSEPTRTEPIWPMNDEEKIKWRAELVVAEATAKVRAKQQKEDTEVKAKWLIKYEEIKKELKLIREEVNLKRGVQKKTGGRKRKTTAEKVAVAVAKANNPRRQKRLGQTKFIDDLIAKGKTDKEIYDAVVKEISEYPVEKIDKLIKLRHYHMKKAKK